MNFPDFELERFGPVDAERITGVSRGAARKYREQGLLPSFEGRQGEFSVFDLAMVMALAGLKARDLFGNKTIAPWLASAIARRALEHENAYAAHPDLFGADPLALAGEVLRQHSRPDPANAMRMRRLFVIFADLTGNFYDAVDADMLEGQVIEPKSIAGPLVVFDTLALGAHILAAAGRPLVRVSEAVPFEAFSRPARVMAD
jgi:hypothetical protein